MEARIINLEEWEQFGGGGFGLSYFNKKDDSVILKLNKKEVSAKKAEEEFLRSKQVYDMGIPSANVYEFVTDGQRYGMIVERIKDKESFGKIISEHPGRLEELSCTAADYAKALHSIQCDTTVFDSYVQRLRNLFRSSENIPDNIKERLFSYLDEMDGATTCLHGDINPCNIIIANGKVYWIDLGDFGYGDPLLDFGIMAHLSHLGPNPALKYLFHMDRKSMSAFTETMGRQYYGKEWDSPGMRERKAHLRQIMAGKALCTWPRSHHVTLPYLRGKRLSTAFNLFVGDHIKATAPK